MSMRRIDVDASSIKTPAALQVYLGYCLDAPDWYGHNLDALYDILTERAQPFQLALRWPVKPTQEMAAYKPRLIRVLNDAAETNPVFSWFEV